MGGGTASSRTRRYAVDLLRLDGSRVATVPVTPNLEPALEAARFRAVRRGRTSAEAMRWPARVEPIWDGEHGEPYLATLRVSVVDDGGAEHTCTIAAAYFDALAEHAALSAIENGRASAGEIVSHRVCAFPVDAARASDAADDGIEEVPSEISIDPGTITDDTGGSQLRGLHDSEDAAVFVPRTVLDDILASARESGDVETGGFLIGRLRRAVETSDVFVEVTEQVPALYAERRAMSIVFTQATWRYVRGVLDLRAGGEVLLGWWHLHPEFCARCPEQSRARCAFRRPFFSNEDVALHAACFPRAWQVALLVTDLGEPELRVNLFGWRDAMIAERGFCSHARRRLDAPVDARAAAGVQRQVGGKRQ